MGINRTEIISLHVIDEFRAKKTQVLTTRKSLLYGLWWKREDIFQKRPRQTDNSYFIQTLHFPQPYSFPVEVSNDGENGEILTKSHVSP